MARTETDRMKTMLAIFALWGLVSSLDAHSAERKKIADVNISALTTELQRNSNQDGVHLIWWIPREFWEVSLLQRPDLPPSAGEALLKMLGGYSMLAIAQGKISTLGEIEFYERDAIAKGAKLELFDGKTWTRIEPLDEIPDQLQTLIKVMSPMLEASLGKMGKNLQFFVLDDDIDGKRLISPYDNSALRVSLTNKSGAAISPLVLEMPVDALFVPRTCPNGKPAHVSWVVCPWDGTKLPQ